MKVPLPKGKYIKNIEVNDDGLDIQFSERKRVALLFISLNERYWPYLKQVVQDCKTNFLPQHKVDYFVWSDMPENELKDVTVIPTEPIEWPHPTLMRYHLFLQQEEKLKDYDYVFYLDADMRVVDKISDEILGEDLTVALHPMYDLNPTFIPPYEPNVNSASFIPRLGQIVDEATQKAGTPQDIMAKGGKPRFKPLYLAGGFQGGITKEFIKAMKVMRDSIDKDFNQNYTAIWNDESHWNKYMFDKKGPILGTKIIVLGPEYIHPDSLIKEYYEPRWGRKLKPKIITLTKPFSLSKEGGKHLNEIIGGLPASQQHQPFECPTCHDIFDVPGHVIHRVVRCPGSGQPHQMDMKKV